MDNISLLQRFIEIIAKEDFLLFTLESKRVISPIVNLIVEDMLKSRAYKFISNPEKVIIESAEEIKNKKNKRSKDFNE